MSGANVQDQNKVVDPAKGTATKTGAKEADLKKLTVDNLEPIRSGKTCVGIHNGVSVGTPRGNKAAQELINSALEKNPEFKKEAAKALGIPEDKIALKPDGIWGKNSQKLFDYIQNNYGIAVCKDGNATLVKANPDGSNKDALLVADKKLGIHSLTTIEAIAGGGKTKVDYEAFQKASKGNISRGNVVPKCDDPTPKAEPVNQTPINRDPEAQKDPNQTQSLMDPKPDPSRLQQLVMGRKVEPNESPVPATDMAKKDKTPPPESNSHDTPLLNAKLEQWRNTAPQNHTPINA